jgi:hypothetical protein
MIDDTTREDAAAPDEAEARDPSAPIIAPAEPEALTDLGDTARSADAALFPAADPVEPEPDPAVAAEEEDEEDSAPFASAEAPWVGAERKWLDGVEDRPAPPAPAPDGDAVAPSTPVSMLAEDDDPLLATSQIPVLPSLLPPAPHGLSGGAKLGIAGALLVVVGGAIGVVYWMGTRFEEREQEILALRAADKQDVVRLEHQIQDLLDKGGAENEARAKELRVQLEAARNDVAGQVAVPPPQAGEVAIAGGEEHRRPSEGGLERSLEGVAATAVDPSGSAPTAAPPPQSGQTGGVAGNPASEDAEEADLLDSALTKPPAAAAEQQQQPTTEFPLGGTTLPESPSRDQVKAAMDGVAGRVKGCGAGGGRIIVSLAVVGATGRVASAEPMGEAAGTPLGLCAARAVKLAKFPPFRQERLMIKYPFDL